MQGVGLLQGAEGVQHDVSKANASGQKEGAKGSLAAAKVGSCNLVSQLQCLQTNAHRSTVYCRTTCLQPPAMLRRRCQARVTRTRPSPKHLLTIQGPRLPTSWTLTLKRNRFLTWNSILCNFVHYCIIKLPCTFSTKPSIADRVQQSITQHVT